MLKLGEKLINKIYLGDKAIAKVFLGEKLVFQAGKPYYCEVEYLESTGTQWIDTDYIPNNNTSVEMVVSGVSENSFALSSSGTWFMGSRQGYLNKAFGFYYNPSNQNFYYAFGNKMPYAEFSSSSLYEKTVKIKIDKTGLYVDDSKIISATDTTFTSPVNLSLFGLNNNGTTFSFTSFKNHSCKISENGVLVRDYIPVLDFDKKPCLYDKVSGKLFYNKGTGDFIAGGRFVESIVFDGDSWIDTEYTPSSNTRVVVSAIFTQWNSSLANYVFGVFGDNLNFGLNVGSARNFFNIPWGVSAGVHDTTKGITPELNVKYNFDISKEGCYINDVEYLSASSFTATFQAQKTMFIGWSNGTSAKGMIGKVAPIQIYESGVLIQDLRPYVDADGVACFKDVITNTLFYNQGTGTLTHTEFPLLTHTQIEYLEGDSVSYIDTGVIGRTGVTVDMNVYFPTNVGTNTYIIGCAESDTERFYAPFLYGSRWSLYIGNSYGKYGGTPTKKEKIHFITETTDGKTQVIDDNNANCSSSNTVETNYTMYLFGVNNYGTAVVGNSNYTDSTGYLRIYDCKIYVDGTLVRDYIPVEKSDGVKCLYDKVEGKYYEFQTA